jgi:hypothetical protein
LSSRRCPSFLSGRYKDLTDSATQALKYLREVGLADTEVEEQADKIERAIPWLILREEEAILPQFTSRIVHYHGFKGS